eukprot:TRINITY_DN862_c0_g1_i8.p1 TRINITY_DN862_c0_g1~~TRINITY_DN862_c0_g1_i8.p1  ORF type:complete len:109 (+),score=11.63 TRINITY_DN862_c0_g1_i8:69-395(+)
MDRSNNKISLLLTAYFLVTIPTHHRTFRRRKEALSFYSFGLDYSNSRSFEHSYFPTRLKIMKFYYSSLVQNYHYLTLSGAISANLSRPDAPFLAELYMLVARYLADIP